MSLTPVSAELRQLVAERADYLCEYCLIAERDTHWGCQIDHIIAEKHLGPTVELNLAYACVSCNLAKGSDISSMDWESGKLVPLFNPRVDRWRDHFRLHLPYIVGITPVGVVTARTLKFNSSDRLLERDELVDAWAYPSDSARRRM
jgi:hypothetical protein